MAAYQISVLVVAGSSPVCFAFFFFLLLIFIVNLNIFLGVTIFNEIQRTSRKLSCNNLRLNLKLCTSTIICKHTRSHLHTKDVRALA